MSGQHTLTGIKSVAAKEMEGMPTEYHRLKQGATKLPSYMHWVCTINLMPEATTPRSLILHSVH